VSLQQKRSTYLRASSSVSSWSRTIKSFPHLAIAQTCSLSFVSKRKDALVHSDSTDADADADADADVDADADADDPEANDPDADADADDNPDVATRFFARRRACRSRLSVINIGPLIST
jgi:hypothetical protein